MTQVNQGSCNLFVGFKQEMFNLDAITSSVSLLSALLPGITEKDPRNSGPALASSNQEAGKEME